VEHADVDLVDVVGLVVVVKVACRVQVVGLHVAEVFGKVLCLTLRSTCTKSFL
jgi:hypothetical protein